MPKAGRAVKGGLSVAGDGAGALKRVYQTKAGPAARGRAVQRPSLAGQRVIHSPPRTMLRNHNCPLASGNNREQRITFPGRSRLARREGRNESVQQTRGLACRGHRKSVVFYHGGMNNGTGMLQLPGQD